MKRFRLWAGLGVTALLFFFLGCGRQPLEAPSPTLTPPSPSTVEHAMPGPGFLRVRGREILDSQGQPLFLRGVNLHTYYYKYLQDPSAPWAYASREDFQYMANLGVNVVRLALHWRYFESSLGFDLIDTYLAWAEEAGIYVILDMHVVPPEDDIREGKIWRDLEAQQRFLDLWRRIATRYAHNPTVAGYDLYNEPTPPDPEQWWTLAERTRQVIRAVDANHILFVQTPQTSIAKDSDAPFRRLDDDNVVYAFHDYAPFVVTHAGVSWAGDAPVPDGFSYPGEVLVDFLRVGKGESEGIQVPVSQWMRWSTGSLVVPGGLDAEMAAVLLSAQGATGAVWFDDVTVLHNGSTLEVLNGDMERASRRRPSQPALWYFRGENGARGTWSTEYAHSGQRSLQVFSEAEGYGEWSQEQWIWMAPWFPVTPGDRVQVDAWIYAPENQGEIRIGIVYLQGVYKWFDRSSLARRLEPYVAWAQSENVPLFVGEFGSVASAPGDSRYRLIEDKIAVMNEMGLHWTLWAYRDGAFGLYSGQRLDDRLADILRRGFER